MAELINMPKLGFDMQEGQLINWLKKPGDTVKMGDVVASPPEGSLGADIHASISGEVKDVDGSIIIEA